MARCAACGTDETLIYQCHECGDRFCESHHDAAIHHCAEGHSWTAATAKGDRDFGRRPHRQRGHHPPEVARPGYRPEDRPTGTSAQGPKTLSEWLRRQTYLSLTLKTAGLAALFSTALYGVLAFVVFGWLPV
jgi:hypothetical protein